MSEQKLLEKKTEQTTDSISETADAMAANTSAAEVNSKPQKNYGVELLRILSMFFIIVLHVINFGGISYFAIQAGSSSTEILPHYKAMYIMLAFCYCAVNCYALISGYVGCKSKFRLSKIVSLWVTVVSINAIMYGVAYLYNPEWVAEYDFINVFLPITNDQYWYFTCYIGLLVLMPALNAAACNIPKKQYRNMLIGMFLVFSCLSIYSGKDLFKISSGYSLVWLVMLYLTGAYFRLHYNPEKKIPFLKTGCALVYILSALAMAFVKFHKEAELLKERATPTVYADDFQYNSMYVVICSLALFVLFINIKIKNRFLGKIIGLVSATTFGVYIIHLNYVVIDNVLTGRWGGFTSYKPLGMVLNIIAVSVLVFVICVMIENVRKTLSKLLFIDKLVLLVDRIKLPEKKEKK